ncbi:MAG: ABC transporter substrate-binding protein [Betaproteobacteria bacterium]|nr:ABC transporter substrate-binding protein [Betaproteobacteria bacterium]
MKALFRHAVTFAAAVFAFAAHAQAPALKEVRVANGTTPDILSIPDVRAFEHFLAKESGIPGKATYVPGAVRAIQAIIADEAEVGIATLSPGLAAVAQGQDIVVFSLASGARPYLVPVATTDIKRLKDLEGQNVGVISLVDSTYYLLVMMMRGEGADPTKVNWRVVGGGAGRANALVAGGIKAAMFQVGQALDLAKSGNHYVVPASNEGLKDVIFKAFWAKRSFLQKYPEVANAIVRAHLQATREALDKSKFMAYAPAMLAPATPESISRAYDVILRMGPWDPNDALLNPKAGEYTINEMVRYQVLATAVPFDKWATTVHVKAAVEKLGTAK